MFAVDSLADMAASVVFENASYNDLEDVGFGNNFTFLKAQNVIKDAYESFEKDGLFQISYKVLVCSQWRLRRNVIKYKPSLIVLVENYGPIPGQESLKDKIDILEQEFERNIYGFKCSFVRASVATQKHSPLSQSDFCTLEGIYADFVRIQGKYHSGPTFYVEYVDKKSMMEKTSSPDAAFCAAITHISSLYEFDPADLERYIYKKDRKAYKYVHAGMKRIYKHWDLIQKFCRTEIEIYFRNIGTERFRLLTNLGIRSQTIATQFELEGIAHDVEV